MWAKNNKVLTQNRRALTEVSLIKQQLNTMQEDISSLKITLSNPPAAPRATHQTGQASSSPRTAATQTQAGAAQPSSSGPLTDTSNHPKNQDRRRPRHQNSTTSERPTRPTCPLFPPPPPPNPWLRGMTPSGPVRVLPQPLRAVHPGHGHQSASGRSRDGQRPSRSAGSSSRQTRSNSRPRMSSSSNNHHRHASTNQKEPSIIELSTKPSLIEEISQSAAPPPTAPRGPAQPSAPASAAPDQESLNF